MEVVKPEQHGSTPRYIYILHFTKKVATCFRSFLTGCLYIVILLSFNLLHFSKESNSQTLSWKYGFFVH